jgi:hypothetical protein
LRGRPEPRRRQGRSAGAITCAFPKPGALFRKPDNPQLNGQAQSVMTFLRIVISLYIIGGA